MKRWKKFALPAAAAALTALFAYGAGEGPKKQPATKPATRPASGPASHPALEWDRPRFEERRDERHRMVSYQIKRRGVRDAATLAAMREVPRHLFIPSGRGRGAYGDYPLGIGYGQTISQPYIVAFMTGLADLTAGEKVLEIGTGSGYQAAVCSEITPHVYSIEIIKALGRTAKTRLKRLGYKTIETKIADGYYGWSEKGPFDAILVTCAASHIPNPLLKQLRPGGKMVIPVGSYGVQNLILVTKDKRGRIRTRNVLPVRFVPLTGGH